MFLYINQNKKNSISKDNILFCNRKEKTNMITYENKGLKYDLQGIKLNDLDIKIQLKQGILSSKTNPKFTLCLLFEVSEYIAWTVLNRFMK